MMTDLQATYEISFDLQHFHNIDMFQRGFYHIVVEPMDSTSIRSNHELHMLKNEDKTCLLPASVNELRAVSKTVQILHKYQEVPLEHTFLFRCHRLMNSRNILESASSRKFFFNVRLCFCSSDDEAHLKMSDFETVSSRKIVLQVDPIQGLHAYTLLLFDYSVMAGVELVVHASLVALHQPLLSTLALCGNGTTGTSNLQTITLESILFSPPNLSKQSALTLSLSAQVQQAVDVHNNIVRILLSIYSHLKDYLQIIYKHVPKQSKYTFEFSEALTKIKSMELSNDKVFSKDEILDQANMNLASACSFVLALWSHILEIACLNRHITNKLAFSYHNRRAQRFQSLFFTNTNPRSLYDEQRSSLYNAIATEIRSSPYYQNLPSLNLESVENDGEAELMPIVFEDKFDVNCQTAPVFKLKYVPFTAQPNVVNHLQETNKTVLPGLAKKETLNDVSKMLNQNNTHVIEGLEQTSTYPTILEQTSMLSQSNFSKEIISHTLEEPDDFPSFSSTLSLRETISNDSISNYAGPGYKSKSASSNTNGPSMGDAEGHNTNLTSDVDPLTVPPLLTSEEPDVSKSHVFTNHVDSSKVLDTCKNNSEKEDNQMLTLQAFLEEDFELSQLHSSICEPCFDDMFLDSSDKCDTCDSGSNIHDGEVDLSSYYSKADTILSLQEKKHATQKSKLLGHLQFPGHLYCDLPLTSPLVPYVATKKSNYRRFNSDTHLIVLVHGLDGSSNDLRIVKTYLQLALSAILNSTGKSDSQVSYLLSVANEKDTYDDLQIMTDKLVDEVLHFIKFQYSSKNDPKRISFVGHSLGGLLIRSAVTSPRLKHLSSRFYTFLSFSAPHLGTVLNSSAIVNTGLWLMQKWKKSTCLRQLSCKEETNFRNTFVYKLSKRKGLEYFKNILLVASAEDRYVPYQSARIEMCKAAFKDKTLGPVYQEMVNNILSSVLSKPDINFLRYHVVHSLGTRTANTVIGRAAHIAVLDSDVFLEQFFLVTALQYFI